MRGQNGALAVFPAAKACNSEIDVVNIEIPGKC